MTKKSTAVTIRDTYEITSPRQVVAMANVLKKHIVENKLYSPIANKNYVQVEGWQFAGGLMGLFPVVSAIEDLSKTGEIKWKAIVEVVNIKTGAVVSRGFAVCSNKENKKKTFDEYAILSMAQTRAIGKAYRNLIGWVMKLAGYEGVPSEEMTKMGETPAPAPKSPINDPVKPSELKKGQVVGPDGQPTYLCSNCDAPISDVVANYSLKVFKRRLCKDCQREIKNSK